MTEPSTVISVRDVSKRFVIHKEKSLKERISSIGRSQEGRKEDFWALRDVSFDVVSGETVGLVGANGSGKSTLLKTIGGIIQPTRGEVRRSGRLAALLELGAGFHPDLTGRENVFLNASILGLSRREAERYFDEMVAFSGIEQFIDTQVKFYSSGMYVRLAFAVAVHVNPEILLVDEVLAVGDEPFQRKCLDKIRSFQHDGRTILLVTHSLETVGDMCSRGVVLRSGNVEFDGDTATAIRVLREGFGAAAAQGDPTDRAGAPEVVSVRLIDADTGRSPAVLGDDASLRLEVTVDAGARELEDWFVGMAIETPLGLRLFGTNTGILEMDTRHLKGTTTVAFEFPGLRLGSGQYFVRVTLGSSDLGTVVTLPRAVDFEVDNGTRNAGIIAVQATASRNDA